jgi:hypothetical protein
MDILFIARAWVKVLYFLTNFVVYVIEDYIVKGTLVYVY